MGLLWYPKLAPLNKKLLTVQAYSTGSGTGKSLDLSAAAKLGGSLFKVGKKLSDNFVQNS